MKKERIEFVRVKGSALMNGVLLAFLVLMAASCAPKQPIQFRTIRNISVDLDASGQPLLRGEAILYNPNRLRMKLKEVKMEILVDGKKSAVVDQKPDLQIPSVAEFPVSVEAKLSLQEQGGLMGAVMNFFGGKKYNVQFVGFVRVKVHGIRVKVPVDYTNEMRLQ